MAGVRCPSCQGANNRESAVCRWCKAHLSVPEPSAPLLEEAPPAAPSPDPSPSPRRASRRLPLGPDAGQEVSLAGAYATIYLLGFLEVAGGAYFFFSGPSGQRMPVAVASGVLAGLFITLARWVQSRRSGVALGLSLLLIGVGVLLLAFAAGREPSFFFGLFVYGSSVIPVIRGFKAIQSLQASDAAKEVLRARLDQRRCQEEEHPTG